MKSTKRIITLIAFVMALMGQVSVQAQSLANLYFDILDCGKHEALFDAVSTYTSDSTVRKTLIDSVGVWSDRQKEIYARELIFNASDNTNTKYYRQIKAYKEKFK